jgi:drug/metabolite transporter (DMT)-like permease
MLSPLRSLGRKAIIDSGVKSGTSPAKAEVSEKGPVAKKSELWSAVGWSTLAFLGFGVQNFIIGYTNELPGEDFKRTIGFLWFGTGLCGLATYASNMQLGVFYTDAAARSATTSLSRSLLFDEASTPTKLSWFPKLVTLGGGVAAGCAQLFMKASFSEDPAAQGPLCSVVCADVILVSVLCHFVYDERLTLGQWLSVLLVFGGLVIMAGLFDPTSVEPGVQSGVSLMGIAYAILAMLCFGGSIFSARVVDSSGMAGVSASQARCLVLGAASTPLLLAAHWEGRSMPVSMPGLWLPLLCGLLQAGSVFAVSQALASGPYTSISIAIFGSNSLVVLGLAALISGQIPSISASIGMALTALGCVTVALTAEQPPAQ